MCEEIPSSATIRSTILREVFPDIHFEEAVLLVGILFEYRIVFSRQFWTLLRLQEITIKLDPFEPQAAAEFVADTFSHDCDKLFLAFYSRWASLRSTPEARGMISRIESHEFVDRLERWPVDDEASDG